MATEWVYWLKNNDDIGCVSFIARDSHIAAKLTTAYAKNHPEIALFWCYSDVINCWFVTNMYGAHQMITDEVPKAIRTLHLIQG